MGAFALNHSVFKVPLLSTQVILSNYPVSNYVRSYLRTLRGWIIVSGVYTVSADEKMRIVTGRRRVDLYFWNTILKLLCRFQAGNLKRIRHMVPHTPCIRT
jgi:hypothetical protein